MGTWVWLPVAVEVLQAASLEARLSSGISERGHQLARAWIAPAGNWDGHLYLRPFSRFVVLRTALLRALKAALRSWRRWARPGETHSSDPSWLAVDPGDGRLIRCQSKWVAFYGGTWCCGRP